MEKGAVGHGRVGLCIRVQLEWEVRLGWQESVDAVGATVAMAAAGAADAMSAVGSAEEAVVEG